ncbi:hypothetical protein SNEBB_008259 [Seison nebaliae]|nr:hypothetical protein SNEBB_008259 [Seison nebaliae]
MSFELQLTSPHLLFNRLNKNHQTNKNSNENEMGGSNDNEMIEDDDEDDEEDEDEGQDDDDYEEDEEEEVDNSISKTISTSSSSSSNEFDIDRIFNRPTTLKMFQKSDNQVQDLIKKFNGDEQLTCPSFPFSHHSENAAEQNRHWSKRRPKYLEEWRQRCCSSSEQPTKLSG